MTGGCAQRRIHFDDLAASFDKRDLTVDDSDDENRGGRQKSRAKTWNGLAAVARLRWRLLLAPGSFRALAKEAMLAEGRAFERCLRGRVELCLSLVYVVAVAGFGGFTEQSRNRVVALASLARLLGTLPCPFVRVGCTVLKHDRLATKTYVHQRTSTAKDKNKQRRFTWEDTPHDTCCSMAHTGSLHTIERTIKKTRT